MQCFCIFKVTRDWGKSPKFMSGKIYSMRRNIDVQDVLSKVFDSRACEIKVREKLERKSSLFWIHLFLLMSGICLC